MGKTEAKYSYARNVIMIRQVMLHEYNIEKDETVV